MNWFLKTIQAWLVHRHADKYLCVLAFSESIFFPVPTDVMLAPMCVVRPRQALYLAFITTVFSVLGGLAGYFGGMLAFHWFEAAWQNSDYWDHYREARIWFDEWGGWAVFLAAFTPIPYKVFTVTAGVLGHSIPIFIVASFLGRGLRFFALALLSRYLGPKLLLYLPRAPRWLFWITAGFLLVLVLLELDLFIK